MVPPGRRLRALMTRWKGIPVLCSMCLAAQRRALVTWVASTSWRFLALSKYVQMGVFSGTLCDLRWRARYTSDLQGQRWESVHQHMRSICSQVWDESTWWCHHREQRKWDRVPLKQPSWLRPLGMSNGLHSL